MQRVDITNGLAVGDEGEEQMPVRVASGLIDQLLRMPLNAKTGRMPTQLSGFDDPIGRDSRRDETVRQILQRLMM